VQVDFQGKLIWSSDFNQRRPKSFQRCTFIDQLWREKMQVL